MLVARGVDQVLHGGGLRLLVLRRGLLHGVDRGAETRDGRGELLGRGGGRLVIAIRDLLQFLEAPVGDLRQDLNATHVIEREGDLQVFERLLQPEGGIARNATRGGGPGAREEHQTRETDGHHRPEERPRVLAARREHKGRLLHEARAELLAELVAQLRLGEARLH